MTSLLFLFAIHFIFYSRLSQAVGHPCFALRLHRSTPVHAILPFEASQLVLSRSTPWSLHIWVKFIEGRPGAIVSPLLDLVDTPLGMRLRACANIKTGWSCVLAKRLWYDDGEWHRLSVLSSGLKISLMLDEVSIGQHSSLEHTIKVGNKAILGYNGNEDMISSSLLLKNLYISKTSPHEGVFDVVSPFLCDNGRSEVSPDDWFWDLNGSLNEASAVKDKELILRFNDLRTEDINQVPFAVIADEDSLLKSIYEERRGDCSSNSNEQKGLKKQREVVPLRDDSDDGLVLVGRELIEVFTSKPNESSDSMVREPKKVLNVIYYSSDERWDAYWELYHNWLVQVILADVRKMVEVRVLVDRCKDPCTLETITLLDHSLVVVNAHSSPKLDPLDVAEEIERRGVRYTALLHANHEKPWVDLKDAPHDWRNGYHGGYQGLTQTYQKWDVVLRHHHYQPLARMLSADSSNHHPGYLYVPLGPAYHILEQPFNQFGSVRQVASSRQVACSFAGAAGQFGGTPDRASMIAAVRTMQNPERCELHVSAEPSKPDQPARQPLDSMSYNKLLFNTRFALCPGGNSFETFRHWESLGAGAIPVSALPPKDHSFAHLWCSNATHVDEAMKRNLAGPNLEERSASYWLSYVEVSGCPLVLLPSWVSLSSLLSAFTLSDTHIGELFHKEGEGAVDVHQKMALLNELQQMVMSRAEVLKQKTAKDVADVLSSHLF